MNLDRRRALSLFALSAGAPAVAKAAPGSGAVRFEHGVASGDPLADRVVIWTRATTSGDAPVEVRWEVAEDAGFTRKVACGVAVASAVRDHTVKVDVGGLKPGRDYLYRFTAGGATSPTGRTRTLPAGKVDEVTLAFVTCSLYPAGYFNAYDHIAKLEKLDAVVELGDYIYEYGARPDDYGMTKGQALGRIPEPTHDIVTLADYRTRYAQYRRDPDLQAAHARAPWICVWDDHEVANDTWKGGAENHNERTEGAFEDRKQAALRAWYEWLPVRDPVPGRAFEAINRSFDFGDLASLTMLESRLTARSYQLEYERAGDIPYALYSVAASGQRTKVDDAQKLAAAKLAYATGGEPPAGYTLGPDVEAIESYCNDPTRQMLGTVQEAWLETTLKASVAAGRPWQVIGNEVVMARCRAPDIAKAIGPERVKAALAAMPEGQRKRAAEFVHAMSFGQPFDLDGWDGYPAARARFDAICERLGGGNVFVFSGDSHAFWANQLHDASGARPVAAEIGVSSVTSPSIGDSAGFQLGAVLSSQNKEVLFNDQLAKGYVRLTLTREHATADMMAVTIAAKPYEAKVLASWRLEPTAGAGVGPLRKV